MSSIRTREVLRSVLLQTLARSPDGSPIHTVYDDVDSRYSFPEPWYREIPASTGHDDLQSQGIDWRTVPQERLIEMVPTEAQWRNELRWARNDLRKSGLLDAEAPRGLWRLTEGGKAAARDATHALGAEERRIATPSQEPRRVSEEAMPARESLHAKLAALTSNMALRDLQLLVDIARSIRIRGIES